MTVDCVDAAGDSSETYEIWDERIELWNGREVMIREEELMTHFVIKAQSIIQDLNEEKNTPPLSSTHDVVIFPKEEESDDRPFFFAPCDPPDYEFAPLDPVQFALIQCGFFKKAWEAAKRAAKKAAKAVKKAIDQIVNAVVNAAQAIADGTKKAADKTVDFVTEHKKEILIAVAVIAAVSGSFLISGAAGTGAAAAGNSSKRKDDKDDDKNTSSSASPPSDPPSPQDLANDLLKSIAPEFSIDNASKESIAAIKAEAHNAWNTFGQLKTLTEQDLAHLKQVDAQFDPSSKSIETVMNTVLTDAQRHELAKMGVSAQNWGQFIQNGHDKIDQAFTALAAHRAAAIPPPSTTFASSFFDKVRLGLEIIGRGMSEPELLDPNSPLDLFFKKEERAIPADLSNQTVKQFVQNITEAFKDEKSSLEYFTAAYQAQNSVKGLSSNEKKILADLVNASKNLSCIRPDDLLECSKIYNSQISTFTIGNYHLLKEELSRVEPFSQPIKSVRYKIDGIDKEGMGIFSLNGMDTEFELALSNARHIQSLCPGNLSIQGIYNHTNNPVIDGLEISLLNYQGISPNTSNFFIQVATDFHEVNNNRPYAKGLFYPHSQGTIHTYNALEKLPKEIRDRIIIVALAPAKPIPKSLCYDSFNYAIRGDLVPYGHLFYSLLTLNFKEFLIAWKNFKEIIWLDPVEGEDKHAFQSSPFAKVIGHHGKDYHERGGEYR